MRPSFALFAAILLAAGACSPAGPDANAEEDVPQGPDRQAGEHALISIAFADGACSARWDGEPLATGAILDRAVRSIDQLVQQAGGPANMMSIPRVVLEVPQAAPYSCYGGALDQLARAGFGEIALRFAGRGPGADRILQVPVTTPAEPLQPYATIDLGGDGRPAMNGRPLDADGLRMVMLELTAPPTQTGLTSGTLLIRAEPAAPFGGLHDLVGRAMEGNRAVVVQPRDAAAAAPDAGNSQAPAT